MIYINMNKCIQRDNFLDAEVWILEEHYNKIKEMLKDRDYNRTSPNFIDLVETDIPKPTYIAVNEFLHPFQEIVNTYGIPRYKEINPAIFTIITFPFLFGIMYADIGHGLIVFLLGLYLCIKKNEWKTTEYKGLSKYRYFFLLIGFFAFYCGLLYNDFMAVPLPIFKSCYKDNIRDRDCVYPFGVDHKWYSSINDLAFMNSMKMKISVIIGVSHMLFGILLKGLNCIFFGDALGFIFEFVPQIIFMSILFGYMNVMIFLKWATDWSSDPGKAPSLISQLMNIFLKFGSIVIKY
jgi:V-type H+-transporting ATPase subunit a